MSCAHESVRTPIAELCDTRQRMHSNTQRQISSDGAPRPQRTTRHRCRASIADHAGEMTVPTRPPTLTRPLNPAVVIRPLGQPCAEDQKLLAPDQSSPLCELPRPTVRVLGHRTLAGVAMPAREAQVFEPVASPQASRDGMVDRPAPLAGHENAAAVPARVAVPCHEIRHGFRCLLGSSKTPRHPRIMTAG